MNSRKAEKPVIYLTFILRKYLKVFLKEIRVLLTAVIKPTRCTALSFNF